MPAIWFGRVAPPLYSGLAWSPGKKGPAIVYKRWKTNHAPLGIEKSDPYLFQFDQKAPEMRGKALDLILGVVEV